MKRRGTGWGNGAGWGLAWGMGVLALLLAAPPQEGGAREKEKAAAGQPAPLPPGSGALLALAEREAGPRLARVREWGGRIEPTTDGRSFVVILPPAGRPAGWIATLHGKRDWSFDQVAEWRPHARSRGLGIVALQWRLDGAGSAGGEYYSPEAIHRELAGPLRKLGATPDRTVLHGFSRGAWVLPPVAVRDREGGNPRFRNHIANAGGMVSGRLLGQAFTPEQWGAEALSGTRWWLWCGGRDPWPREHGCPAMRRMREQLAAWGVPVVLTEDPEGEHGGFLQHPARVGAALEALLPLP